MLILMRRRDESIICTVNGVKIEIKVCDIYEKHVKIGFNAPREVNIVREELIKNDLKANKETFITTTWGPVTADFDWYCKKCGNLVKRYTEHKCNEAE